MRCVPFVIRVTVGLRVFAVAPCHTDDVTCVIDKKPFQLSCRIEDAINSFSIVEIGRCYNG